MLECHCGEFTSSDRRTCPNGHIVNPEGRDPPVQQEPRPGATLANLRSENLHLRKLSEEHERSAKQSADHAALLQESLEDLAADLELLLLEQRQMREGFRDLTERSRLLQSRFEALGMSTFRPFAATQATLFEGDVSAGDGSQGAQ